MGATAQGYMVPLRKHAIMVPSEEVVTQVQHEPNIVFPFLDIRRNNLGVTRYFLISKWALTTRVLQICEVAESHTAATISHNLNVVVREWLQLYH